jgi:hypothetical protein
VIWGGTSPPFSFHGESRINLTLTAERFLPLASYEHQIRGGKVAAVHGHHSPSIAPTIRQDVTCRLAVI